MALISTNSKAKKSRLITALSLLFLLTAFAYFFMSLPSSSRSQEREAMQMPMPLLPKNEQAAIGEVKINSENTQTTKTQAVNGHVFGNKRAPHPTELALKEFASDDTIEQEAEVATARIENYDSGSSIEITPREMHKGDNIWSFSADIRPIYNSYEKILDNGEVIKDSELSIRIRGDAIATISDNLRAGIGVAGICALSNCDADFTFQANLPGSTGLKKGQITIDEMYLHWLSDEPHRFKLAVGRMQTRSVLKTGVFNKSLDRVNSNNARINWTDGVHAAYQFDSGWTSNFIMQYNSNEGSGNVYHNALDFSDSDAQKSYFASFESNQEVSAITQRSIGISYLPSALLSENGVSQDISSGVTPDITQEPSPAAIQNHDDYWGVVGKLAWLWPQTNSMYTLRGGFELGYSPTQPNHNVVGIVDDKAVSGLAWNAVFNIMDIYPGHNFGINYGHTGAGWQLSPQYTPNTKLLEFRYQWQLKSGTLFEARLRWQDELETSQASKDNLFQEKQTDFYLRLTRNF